MGNTQVNLAVKAKTVKSTAATVAAFIATGDNSKLNIGDRLQLVTVSSGEITAIRAEYVVKGATATAANYDLITAPTISVTPTTLTAFDADGEEKTITVASLSSFTTAISGTSGTGASGFTATILGNTIAIEAATNTELARTATLTITSTQNSLVTTTVALSQAGV